MRRRERDRWIWKWSGRRRRNRPGSIALPALALVRTHPPTRDVSSRRRAALPDWQRVERTPGAGPVLSGPAPGPNPIDNEGRTVNIYDKLAAAEAVRAWALEQAIFTHGSRVDAYEGSASAFNAEIIDCAKAFADYVAGDMKSDAAKTQFATGGVTPAYEPFRVDDGCVVPHVATTLSADELQRLAECAVPHTDGNPGILQTT